MSPSAKSAQAMEYVMSRAKLPEKGKGEGRANRKIIGDLDVQQESENSRPTNEDRRRRALGGSLPQHPKNARAREQAKTGNLRKRKDTSSRIRQQSVCDTRRPLD